MKIIIYGIVCSIIAIIINTILSYGSDMLFEGASGEKLDLSNNFDINKEKIIHVLQKRKDIIVINSVILAAIVFLSVFITNLILNYSMQGKAAAAVPQSSYNYN